MKNFFYPFKIIVGFFTCLPADPVGVVPVQYVKKFIDYRRKMKKLAVVLFFISLKKF